MDNAKVDFSKKTSITREIIKWEFQDVLEGKWINFECENYENPCYIDFSEIEN